MADLIITMFPNDQLASFRTSLQSLSNQFSPYFRNLSAKERGSGLRSMAEGREGYVRMIFKIGSAHPNDLNRRDKPEDLETKLQYDGGLEDLRQEILTLLEQVQETQKCNAVDIMTVTDAFANALQDNRSRNSALDKAMEEVDEYNKRFGSTSTPIEDTTAPADAPPAIPTTPTTT